MSSLFTDDPEFEKRRADLEAHSVNDILALLTDIFGVAQMRLLADSDKNALRWVLRQHASRVASRVEGHYCHELMKQSEESALNTLRGTLAGIVSVQRDRGVEIEDWVEPFILGETEFDKETGKVHLQKIQHRVRAVALADAALEEEDSP